MNSELIILGIAGIGLLGGIGVIFGTGLGYAAKKFAVKGEPLVEEVLESLPMAQCGGCLFPCRVSVSLSGVCFLVGCLFPCR